MDLQNMLPVVALLALAVIIVVVLLRVMRARRAGDDRRAPEPKAETDASPPLSKEEQEYLDSSHILPAGRDALDTRADAWRNNKRK